MSLIDKIVKHKRMQRLSGSLAMIIPETWIRNLEWDQRTPFAMEFKPYTRQIIITEEGTKVVKEACDHVFNEGTNLCKYCGEKYPKTPEDNQDGEEISEPVIV